MPYFYGIKSCLEHIRIEIPEIPGIEPVPPDKLHITVLYIGSRRPTGNVLKAVESKLSSLRPFRIVIGPDLDFFPNLSKPRALVLKISEGLSSLQKLRSILISALQEQHVSIEDRYLHNFNPHMTIGWVKVKLDPVSAERLLEDIKAILGDIEIEVTVNKIDLVDSTGGSYRVLHSHVLS